VSALRLLLFDIDGTLVNCGAQIRPLFAGALREVYGTAGDCDTYSFVGRTDPEIVLELMTAAGVAAEEVAARLPRMRDLYLGRLAAALDRDAMCLLPGVAKILSGLANRRDLALALLTGNWEGGARAKLAPFDLNRFFAFGAFGGDAGRRSDLLPIALTRAEQSLGKLFQPAETLIIGDSIHDVACGHDHGIAVLAVATGRTPAAALRAAGADWVVPDLFAAREVHPWLAGRLQGKVGE
jgi:phosphoglycolate phosphatase